MSKENFVAPKERINIHYVPFTSGQQSEVELPLQVMVVGDFHGKTDSTPIEERQILSVDKNNFNAVMQEASIGCEITIPNKLESDAGTDLKVSLKINTLDDFEPDSLVQQVPELRKLIEFREALVALKGPLGNLPAFRRSLQGLLDDEASRNQLLSELYSIKTGNDAPKASVLDIPAHSPETVE